MLTALWEKSVKMEARVVRHGRSVTFQVAEGAVPRELFARMLERIQWFGMPPPLVQGG